MILVEPRNKLCPNSRDPPTAMIDEFGNHLTSPSALEDLVLKTYKKRLENRPIKETLEGMRIEKEELCEIRIDQARQNKTQPWSKDALNKVLKQLKKNKSRDPSGYANEIF